MKRPFTLANPRHHCIRWAAALWVLLLMTACNSMASKGYDGKAFVPGRVPRIEMLNWKIVTPPKNFYVDDSFAPEFQRTFAELLRTQGVVAHGSAQAGVTHSLWKEQTAPNSIEVVFLVAPRLLIKYAIGNYQGYCVSATFQAELYPQVGELPVWSIREASCSAQPEVLAQRIYARMKQDRLL
jgi:hypothetical protein